MKEVYFLAKDIEGDRFLIHKVVLYENGKPHLVGGCATIEDAPESSYETIKKRVNDYRNEIDNIDRFNPKYHYDEAFYEAFSLWLIEYFDKYGVTR